MRTILPVIAAGLLIASNAQATGLDFSLSNETANIEYLAPVGKLARGFRQSQLESNGLLTAGVFYNDLDDVIGNLKLVAVGQETSTRVPYQLEFGVKAFAGNVAQDDTRVGALAIGGGIKIQLPRRYNPIDFRVDGFFTPGITTFGDTNSLLEIGARLSVEIVPSAKAFIGYRLLEVENEDNFTLELDDNIHLGVRLQF